MKNNLLILFFCLLSCSVVAQQVISDDALSTKRRTSSSFRSTVYYPWAYSAYSISDPVATTPIYHIGSLPAATIHSGSMAAQVTAPFATYSEPNVGKRRIDWGGLNDMGERDKASPIGSNSILYLFCGAMIALIAVRQHRKRGQLNNNTTTK